MGSRMGGGAWAAPNAPFGPVGGYSGTPDYTSPTQDYNNNYGTPQQPSPDDYGRVVNPPGADDPNGLYKFLSDFFGNGSGSGSGSGSGGPSLSEQLLPFQIGQQQDYLNAYGPILKHTQELDKTKVQQNYDDALQSLRAQFAMNWGHLNNDLTQRGARTSAGGNRDRWYTGELRGVGERSLQEQLTDSMARQGDANSLADLQFGQDNALMAEYRRLLGL